MESKRVINLPNLNWDLTRFKKDPEKQFFVLTGFWFFFIVFAGFADSFYIKKSTTLTPNYLMFHGIVYTIWVLLYLLQCVLVSSKNIQWHMLLGKTTILILPLVLISGIYAVLHSAVERMHDVKVAAFSEIVLGCIFIFLAILKRKKPYSHKRLMLMAMTFLTVAAVQRLFRNFWDISDFWFYYTLFFMPLISLVIFDLFYYKKIKYLSLSLLAFMILYKWLEPYKLFFETDLGKNLIELLNKIFL